MNKFHRFIRLLPIIGLVLTLTALFMLFLMPSPVLAARVVMTMSIDSTQSADVWGGDFGPNSQVTLEIDNGNNESVEYTETKSADSSGVVIFYPSENWSVQPGDLVRLFDDTTLPNIKEHIVNYLTLESVDYVSDTFAGITDPNTPVSVGVMSPSGPVFSSTEADGTGNWSVDFSGTFDIVVGTTAWVETSDSDGDNTHINWTVEETLTIDVVLTFFDDSVVDGKIYGLGKIPCLANFRLWLFREMLETAKSFIEAEKRDCACRALNRAQLRCDSELGPKDFIQGEGEAVPELHTMITELREELGCE